MVYREGRGGGKRAGEVDRRRVQVRSVIEEKERVAGEEIGQERRAGEEYRKEVQEKKRGVGEGVWARVV